MKRPWFIQPFSFALLALFIIANAAYLHRVPGLLGDEGSEGENVFQLLHNDTITIVGERSYIGPIIDYVRVPYIFLFGYTPLALRMLMLTANILTFLLAGSVLRRAFGNEVGMVALVVFSFSPIFLLEQRLGWAITLNVFFAWLLMYALLSAWKQKWLLSGLIAGIGLSNDVIFLPTLIGIITVFVALYLCSRSIQERAITLVRSSWLFIVGFFAGFGTQLAVLLLQTDDQGRREEVTADVVNRVYDFLPALPLYLSSSSYVARYTGMEFSSKVILASTIVLALLAVVGLFHKKRIHILAIAIGLCIHAYFLLYMIDRFNLRYFAVLSMGVWLLSGIGLGVMVQRFIPARFIHGVPVVIALGLMLLTAHTTLIPFLKTGGSLNEFSLGNRNDKASAFVDIRPLVSCVQGKGEVYALSQDIFDRLQYTSRENSEIAIVDGEHKKSAKLTVSYKKPNNAYMRDDSSLCPEIPFFTVLKK